MLALREKILTALQPVRVPAPATACTELRLLRARTDPWGAAAGQFPLHRSGKQGH